MRDAETAVLAGGCAWIMQLEVFFQTHRADLDESIVGSPYRSEVFCTSAAQRSARPR